MYVRILDRAAAARTRLPRLALDASVVAAMAIALAIGWTRNAELALAGIDFVVFEEAQTILDTKPQDAEMLHTAAERLARFLAREARWAAKSWLAELVAFEWALAAAFDARDVATSAPPRSPAGCATAGLGSDPKFRHA